MKNDMNNFLPKIMISRRIELLSLSILLLRCTIGVILFIVGAGKVMGWFGGFGMETSLKFYSQMGISVPFAYLSCYTEFLGGLLMAIGFLTRPAAFAVTINMIVATIISLPSGFFGSGGGASYPFTFTVMAVSLLLTGPLKFSVDYFLWKKSEWDLIISPD